MKPPPLPNRTQLPRSHISPAEHSGRVTLAIWKLISAGLPSSVWTCKRCCPVFAIRLPFAARYFCPLFEPGLGKIGMPGAISGGAMLWTAPLSMMPVTFTQWSFSSRHSDAVKVGMSCTSSVRM